MKRLTVGAARDIVGHDDGHVEVDGLGLGETVGAGHVVLDGQVAGEDAVGGRDEVAGKGAGAVGVDLVQGDGDLGAGLDGRDGVGADGVLLALGHVNVGVLLRPAAHADNVGVDLGVTDDGGVQLARVDGRAVSRQRSVD